MSAIITSANRQVAGSELEPHPIRDQDRAVVPAFQCNLYLRSRLCVGSELVAEQVREGRKVAMLGNGINDASGLAGAAVGVAMGAGANVARESVNVVLIGRDLERFAETVRIARNCRRFILENLYGTLS